LQALRRAVVGAQLHAALTNAVRAHFIPRHHRRFAPRATRREEIDLKIAFDDEKSVRAQTTELHGFANRGRRKQHLATVAVDHRRLIRLGRAGQSGDVEHTIAIGVDQAAGVGGAPASHA